MDVYGKIVEMFWSDYAAKSGKDAPDAGQSQLLQDFLAWLEARKTGGMLTDLRLVRNQATRATVDRIMGVEDSE